MSILFEGLANDSKALERAEANIDTAKSMLKRGKISIEQIAEDSNLSIETVIELQKQGDVYIFYGRAINIIFNQERLKLSTLFEEIAKDSRVEGRIEGKTEANIETAKRMLRRGKLSIGEIAEDTNLSTETILELQKQENLQSL